MGLPLPTKCSCPTNPSSDFGRILLAKGSPPAGGQASHHYTLLCIYPPACKQAKYTNIKAGPLYYCPEYTVLIEFDEILVLPAALAVTPPGTETVTAPLAAGVTVNV